MSLTKRIPEVLGLVAALVLAGGCETLNVKNPNAPDSGRLLTDPATVQSIAIGAMRTWYSTTQGPTDGADRYPGLTLSVMAKSHVAAWNNYNIRFYTGCTDAPFPGYLNGSCNAAIAKFDHVINNLTTAKDFTGPGDFFGKPAQSYDNVAIAQIASTMAARTLAYFPRTAAENADKSVPGGQVDWAKVPSYAKNGI